MAGVFVLAFLFMVSTTILIVFKYFPERLPRREPLVRLPREIKTRHAILALAALLMLFIASGPRGLEFLFFPVALLALAFYFLSVWGEEFLFLMSLSDDQFPGRNDKLVWAIVLTVMAPVGLWVFRSYRQAHWPVPHEKPLDSQAAADFS